LGARPRAGVGGPSFYLGKPSWRSNERTTSGRSSRDVLPRTATGTESVTWLGQDDVRPALAVNDPARGDGEGDKLRRTQRDHPL